MKANAPEKIYLDPALDALTKALSEKTEYDVEYTRTDVFIEKGKEAFCKATCNGHPPRSTCTSLGTCKEYDNFVKFLREE